VSWSAQSVQATRAVAAAALAAALAAAFLDASAVTSHAAVQRAAPSCRVLTAGRVRVGSLASVTAIGRKNAWVGGSLGSTPGRPLIEHWNGRGWSRSKLPTRLSGGVQQLSASRWNNVWAFGAGVRSGFALRWNGRRWLVMKRWTALTSVAGAVVRGPANVWVFSRVSALVQHFNGRRWVAVRVAPFAGAFESVTSLPTGEVWAIALNGIVHGTVSKSGGYTWSVISPPSYPDPNTGGPSLTHIYARSPTSVWADGGGVRRVGGRARWYPLLARWDGQSWHRIAVSGKFILGQNDPVSDGHGGLWLTTGWDSGGVPPHMIHFAGGKLVPVSVPPRDGRYVGVYGLAKIPGMTSVWVGASLTGLGALGPSSGLIVNCHR